MIKDDFPCRVQTIPIWIAMSPCMPMYGVFISQLLRFARACVRYSDFLSQHNRLVRTLLDQGFRCRKFKQFTRPTIPCSSIIPSQWRSISGRVSIVSFGDGASAFRWLAQRWLAPTDYQFTLSLVYPWLFPPSFFLFLFLFLFFWFIFFIFFLFFHFCFVDSFIYWFFFFFLSFLFKSHFVLFYFIPIFLIFFFFHSLSLLFNSLSWVWVCAFL